MNIYSITCSFPFENTDRMEKKCSILMRIAAIATGIVLLLIGFFILHDFAYMQIGVICGWTFIETGIAFALLGIFLKAYKKESKELISKNENLQESIHTRHMLHNQNIQLIDNKIFDEGVKDTGDFACLPLEVLHSVFDRLEVSNLLTLEMSSRTMYQKVASYFRHKFPVKSTRLSDHNHPVVDIREIESPEVKRLFFELCEVDKLPNSGMIKKGLSEERFQEIVDILKEQDRLYLLNSFFMTKAGLIISPLLHWASKGKLDFVTSLVEHGAMDYLANIPFCYWSALFKAAQGGHIEIVDYLLKNGAHADIRFKEYRFSPYFIPYLICSESGKYKKKVLSIESLDSQIACLKRILDYMVIYQPDQLKFQLTISLMGERNIFDFLKTKQKNPYLKQVYTTLKQYQKQ